MRDRHAIRKGIAGRWLRRLALAATLFLPVTALADYSVQVGAFANPDNAARVVKRLRSLGYDEVQRFVVQSGRRILHLVLVGRTREAGQAARLKARLAGQGWNGFVRRYPETAVTVAPRPAAEPQSPAVAEPPSPAPAVTLAPPPTAEPEPAPRGEWSGSMALELRAFPQGPAYPRQRGSLNASLAIQPEYYREWNGGSDSFTFVPFLRLDNRDPERTHADLRELTWLRAAEDWELRVGVRRVFWGVTESVHLVDVINQVDLVENTDTEDRLGQPMINLALIRDWGTVDLFLLTGFRERTFPGPRGRLRTEPYIDTDQARYESGAEWRHLDLAARWSRTLGPWDIGLAQFHGTGREPILQLGLKDGQPVLVPYYPIINQTSLDLQATLGDWLWKLEWLTRDGQGDRFTAAAGGFEYTFVGIFDTAADLGVISEYLFDDRGSDATTLFQNDLMIGLRLTLNDAQSSELLFGASTDLDGHEQSFNLEASRRLGDQWKLSIEARFARGLNRNGLFGSIRNDDYVQAELAWYF
ncbi:SPOR domain-containing protein [Thiohalobacter sp.]|uniref:SPOR domain-containing protein n=1 Tax=Thiohalobacter sp. TaxID=2025948 RepID=UPI00261D99F5|nr:SPOR domain-containing protein [Thiohalobacter sp.]